MNTRPIIVTTDDRSKLEKLVADANSFLPGDLSAARALALKLANASTVATGEIPADTITLYSRAGLLDLEGDEELELTIVPPCEADASEGRISVLAPIGMGMLGSRVGDVFEQTTPSGTCRFRVLNVLHQPESHASNHEATSHALPAG